jgi:hypothetical protein
LQNPWSVEREEQIIYVSLSRYICSMEGIEEYYVRLYC